MDLSKILSISGKSGLFKVVSQLKNAVLVESLADKRRFPAFAHDKISSMEEIAVFTMEEDKPLKDVLKSIYEKQEGKPTLDPRSDDKVLKEYFKEVVPDYDPDRVYISDMRKIITWYNLLLEHGLLDFSEKEEENKEEGSGDVAETVKTEEKPRKHKAEPKAGARNVRVKKAGNTATGAPRQRKTGD
jgi:hypothetical protein